VRTCGLGPTCPGAPGSIKAAASHRAAPFRLETLHPELTAAAANPSRAVAVEPPVAAFPSPRRSPEVRRKVRDP
jgi:hypothetical protein